jgi:uncharacterized protein YbaA (DUF1428 family)
VVPGFASAPNAIREGQPQPARCMDPKDMPFDAKRMIYGGFDVLVDV